MLSFAFETRHKGGLDINMSASPSSLLRLTAACPVVIYSVSVYVCLALFASPAYGLFDDEDPWGWDDFDYIIDDDSPDPFDMDSFVPDEWNIVERTLDQTWTGSANISHLEFLENPNILISGDLYATIVQGWHHPDFNPSITVTGSFHMEEFSWTNTVGGEIRMGDGGTTGSFHIDDFMVHTLSLFEVNRADDIDFDPGILNTSIFRQAGSGTTTLTGQVKVQDRIEVTAGRLNIHQNDLFDFDEGTVSVAENTTLDMTGTSGGVYQLESIDEGGLILSGGNEFIHSGSINAQRGTINNQLVPVDLELDEGSTLRLQGPFGTIFSARDNNALYFPGDGDIVLEGNLIEATRVDFGQNTVHNKTDLRAFPMDGAVTAENIVNDGTIDVIRILTVHDTISGSGEVIFRGTLPEVSAWMDFGHFTGEQKLTVRGESLDVGTAERRRIGGHFDNSRGIDIIATASVAGSSIIETDIELIEFAGQDRFGNDIESSLTFLGRDIILSGTVFGEGTAFARSGSMTTLEAGEMDLSGGLVIQGGTFQVGDFNTQGNLANPVDLEGGNLQFARNDLYVFDEAISGNGVVRQLGQGELLLSGDSTYTGLTVVENGSLRVGHENALGASSVEIYAGAVFDTGDYDFDLSRVNGTGEFRSERDYVFDSGENHTSEVQLTGDNALIKRGEGILTLTREQNDYTGGTIVSEGLLQAGSEAVFGALPNNIVLKTGGAIGNLQDSLSLGEDRNIILAEGGGRLRAGGGNTLSVAGVISGTGDLRVVNETGTVTLSGTNTYEGSTIIGGSEENGGYAGSDQARLRLESNNALPYGNVVNFDAGSDNTGILDFDGQTVAVEGMQVSSGTGRLENASGATIGSGGIAIAEGAVFDSLGQAFDLGMFSGDGDYHTGAGYVYNGDEEKELTVGLSGNNELRVGGGGRLIVNRETAHTGGTVIESGELQLGDGETLGTVVGSLNIDAAGMLAIMQNEDLAFSNNTAGEGGLIKRGSGIVEMTGANNYSGITRIEEGGLRLGPASYPSGMGVVEILEGATFHASRGPVTQGIRGGGNVDIEGPVLWMDVSEAETFVGTISGTGDLNKRQAGIQSLQGEVGHSGQTNVLNGRLEIAGGLETTGGLVDVSPGATLAAGGTVVRNLSNSGTVTTMNGEALTLTGEVSGSGRFEGDFVFSGATYPGTSPGLIEVEGNLSFAPEHFLKMEIAGPSRGQEYDAFDISGDLLLDGTLKVVFLDGFQPQEGDTFLFFDVGGSIDGSFADLILPNLNDTDLIWDAGELTTTGSLGVIPEPRTYALIFGLAALVVAFLRRRS